MAGRFEGVSDLAWRLFEDVFPPAPQQRRRGMPHASLRKILNTLLYLLITGAGGVIPRVGRTGRRRVPCSAGDNAGRPMAPSRRCQRAYWGLPRNRG